LKEKQSDKAVAVLEEAYQSNPPSAQLLSNLVQTHIGLKQFDEAVAVCQARLAQNPEDAFTFNLLGAIYTANKKFPEAEKALQKATELQPTWPAPYNNLARVYLAQGKTDEAIAKFQDALAANPQNAGVYLALGSIYEQKKDFQNAMKVYEKALEVHPSMWAAANNLAFLLGESSNDSQNLERALSLARKASELRPGEPLVLDTLAWIQYKLGDLPQARQYLTEALAQTPENPVFNYHMGVILMESGNTVEAKQKLETALASNLEFAGRNEAEEMLKKLQ
jgi:Flp pilus assembly protein TadD